MYGFQENFTKMTEVYLCQINGTSKCEVMSYVICQMSGCVAPEQVVGNRWQF